MVSYLGMPEPTPRPLTIVPVGCTRTLNANAIFNEHKRVPVTSFDVCFTARDGYRVVGNFKTRKMAEAYVEEKGGVHLTATV